MKKFYLLLFLPFFISCGVSKISSGTAKTIDIRGQGVVHKPVIADLVVKQQKISATISYSVSSPVLNAETEVVRKALKDNNADILVEPSYEYVTSRGTTELTVTGWPANYQNFRQIEEDDLQFFNMRSDESKTTVIVNKPEEEKK